MRSARKRILGAEGHESGMEQSVINNLVYMNYEKAYHDIASYNMVYHDIASYNMAYFNKV